MRIIVCGGRYFSDRSVVFWALDLLHSRREIMLVIHGDCRGADRLARSWARRHEVPDLSFRAQWHRHGDAAGPIRNRQMLEDGWMGKIDGVTAKLGHSRLKGAAGPQAGLLKDHCQRPALEKPMRPPCPLLSLECMRAMKDCPQFRARVIRDGNEVTPEK